MIYLLFVTLLGCGDSIIPFIVLKVINLLSKETNDEWQLRSEITDLKRQLQNVSMVDQFPAYAKLQRKINSLTTQHKNKANERKTDIQKMKFVLNIILKGVVISWCLWLIWSHKGSPVVSLPADLVWPLGSFLALPACQPGELSVMMWLAIVRTGSPRLIKIFKNKGSGLAPSVNFEGT